MYEDAVAIAEKREAKQQKRNAHPDIPCPGKKDCKGFKAVFLRYMDDNGGKDHDEHEDRNPYAGPGSKGKRCLCLQKEVKMNPAVDGGKKQGER